MKPNVIETLQGQRLKTFLDFAQRIENAKRGREEAEKLAAEESNQANRLLVSLADFLGIKGQDRLFIAGDRMWKVNTNCFMSEQIVAVDSPPAPFKVYGEWVELVKGFDYGGHWFRAGTALRVNERFADHSVSVVVPAKDETVFRGLKLDEFNDIVPSSTDPYKRRYARLLIHINIGPHVFKADDVLPIIQGGRDFGSCVVGIEGDPMRAHWLDANSFREVS